MHVIAFQHCTFTEWPAEARCETSFPDGARCPAAPIPGDIEQAMTAFDLGYGSQLWRMCREHELLHTIRAEALGLPYSPTLNYVAHGEPADGPSVAERHAEEADVLALQKYLNTGEAGPALGELAARCGCTLPGLAQHARRVMRGEPSTLKR